MSSNIPNHIPVLIVGGGIVGLSASLLLFHHSIPCVLVERHATTSIHPRGRSVNARTMEIYRSISIADDVRRVGAALGSSMGIYSGNSLEEVIGPKERREKKREFPFQNLFEKTGPEPGQFGTQDLVEPVLLEAARERGVDARFYTECVSIQQNEDGVIATIKNRSDNTTSKITADYVIAADGANSPMRTQLKIERSGQGFLGNLLNILFHADLGPFVKNREFSICQINRPEVSGAFTAINNSDRWVFHLSYDPTKGEKQEDFPPERCVDLLRIALGMPDIKIEIKSIMPWQASVRIAEKFRVGRVFLAGDAAHQMPPYAGQGANSGISDVHNLAWKLAAVLKEHAAPSLLDTYEVERFPVDLFAAEASGAASDERGLISLKKDTKTIGALIRRLPIMSGFGYTYSSKAIMEESSWPLGGLSWRAWTMPSVFLYLDGRPGSRAPHLWVERDGKRISTLDLMGKEFVLLAGSDGGPWLEAAERIEKQLGGVGLLKYTLGPKGDIYDPEYQFQVAAGILSTGFLMVRPDGFVACRERRLHANYEKRLKEVMARILGH